MRLVSIFWLGFFPEKEVRQTNFECQLRLSLALRQRVHYGNIKIEYDFVGKLRGKGVYGDEVVECIDQGLADTFGCVS